ncbi:hypothetical protein [Longimicrobium sp.]|uniref:hypothetical protein n=1 Tax=Longimicrobium sp. TaxID=2029185 RepID=UPI002C63F74D|nr:hypothetical protein [Longimicrobium sp.]HSU15666.1 hypothetical protein [Longimicrobium sp.]
MRRNVVLILSAALAGLSSCTPPPRVVAPPPIPGAAGVLARAIGQAGGAEALERARALSWKGEATVRAGGRTVRIEGVWAVQPPDTAVVSTWEEGRGRATERSLVYAAPRGWIVSGGRFQPMPAAMLANERDEFFLYQVMRLVPLRAPGVTLAEIPPDSAGQAGIRAMVPGRPPVELYVDATGRLAHVRMPVRDPAGGAAPVTQDVWLQGAAEEDDVVWPTSMRITLNGAPYFDMEIHDLETMERLEDPRLGGPR